MTSISIFIQKKKNQIEFTILISRKLSIIYHWSVDEKYIKKYIILYIFI